MTTITTTADSAGRAQQQNVTQLLMLLLRMNADRSGARVALDTLYDEWIKRRERNGLRNTHNERTQLELHVLPVIGRMPLDEIRVRHMRDLVDGLRGTKRLAPRTVRSIYGTVHKMFADLVVDERITTSPCALTKDQLPPLRDKDPEWRAGAVFSRDEVELLISARAIRADRRMLNAINFLAGTRFGEMAGLRWRDFDEQAEPLKRLAIVRSYDQRTKTDVPRLVPVHPVLAEMLAEWREGGFMEIMGRRPKADDLIVPSTRGRVRSGHWRAFRYDLKKLGLRHRRIHDTRRTLITLARVDGARRDVLEQITHTPKRCILDLYTTLPWPTLCDAIACIKVRRLDHKEVTRRLIAIAARRQ